MAQITEELQQNKTRHDNPISLIREQIERARRCGPQDGMECALVAYMSAKTLKESFEQLMDDAEGVVAGLIAETHQERWYIEHLARVEVVSAVDGAKATIRITALRGGK